MQRLERRGFSHALIGTSKHSGRIINNEDRTLAVLVMMIRFSMHYALTAMISSQLRGRYFIFRSWKVCWTVA
jgi:hypothetical protein